MFAVASKVLEFLLMPTVWVAIALALAIFKKKRVYLWTAISLYLFFTNAYILNVVLSAWEVPATPLKQLPRVYPCTVVLGGFTQLGRQPQDRVYLNTAADRLMHAFLLFNKKKTDRILISGGNGTIIKYTDSEAGNAARLSRLCGIPRQNLLVENKARTTRENATLSQIILRNQGIKDTVLLITSAFHARRAAGCFTKVGVPFRLFTTDFRSNRANLSFQEALVPSAEALVKWDMLLHEWGGFAAYWIVGYL
jgi:uncharacterized SAM-binding protein YcdF (DUF218 family)